MAVSQDKAREFQDRSCWWSGAEIWNLLRHIKSTHEGVKYSCGQCDYKATDKGNDTDELIRFLF